MTEPRGSHMSSLMDEARTRVPRIAEAAVERARLTVVPRATGRRAARVPFVTLVSVILVAGVAGLLFFNTSMQQVSFTATSLEHRASLLDAEQQGLQMQIDSLRNPQRLATRAKHLGMVPPASPAFIKLGNGTVLGTPTPASWADAIRINSLPTRRPKDLRPKPRRVIEKVPANATFGTGTSTDPTKTTAGSATNPATGGAAPGAAH
jgi:cell division protein FtsL